MSRELSAGDKHGSQEGTTSDQVRVRNVSLLIIPTTPACVKYRTRRSVMNTSICTYALPLLRFDAQSDEIDVDTLFSEEDLACQPVCVQVHTRGRNE